MSNWNGELRALRNNGNDGYGSDLKLTKGNIYKVTNGQFVYDSGATSCVYNSFAHFVECNSIMKDYFEEVKELWNGKIMGVKTDSFMGITKGKIYEVKDGKFIYDDGILSGIYYDFKDWQSRNKGYADYFTEDLHRFKVGDVVKVITNKCCHGFEIGQTVTIVEVLNDCKYYTAKGKNKYGCNFSVRDDELEVYVPEVVSTVYKIGDRVKITKRLNGHRFEIGQIVTVDDIMHQSGNGHYILKDEIGIGWALSNQEFELAPLTLMDKFFELFPNAPKNSEGLPKTCPRIIGYENKCELDCKDCWKQEIKEEK